MHPLGETSTTLSDNPVTRTRLLYSRGTRGYWSGTMFSGVIVNVVADLGGLSHATKGRETLETFDAHLHRGEKGEWEDNDIVELQEEDGGIISGIISEEEAEIQEK